ncbi:MAG: OB-fold domain-containing protein [Acetobacteraceae bacterium]|nr:OB-fold domain-containing protein [Pseudomonadota bacterium]
MAYVARKIPFVGTPDTNPETKPFFEACDQGKLMIKRCTKCKKPHFYPRDLCPFCFGDTTWEQASGKGTVYSFSTLERGSPPHTIAYVKLAEGPTVLTNIVEVDPKEIKIGQNVVVTFIKTEDGPSLPFFKPA